MVNEWFKKKNMRSFGNLLAVLEKIQNWEITNVKSPHSYTLYELKFLHLFRNAGHCRKSIIGISLRAHVLSTFLHCLARGSKTSFLSIFRAVRTDVLICRTMTLSREIWSKFFCFRMIRTRFYEVQLSSD